jgi:uncharacterized membrane protein YedE/YeeE
MIKMESIGKMVYIFGNVDEYWGNDSLNFFHMILRGGIFFCPGSWWLRGFCGFYGPGSWWLLVASMASMAPMVHLSSIDQSISEACSPGACCALDARPSISFYIYI